MSRFNLPVFKKGAEAVTAAELFRRAMHAEEIYFSTLGEKSSFDFGVGLCAEEFPEESNANSVRDVVMVPGVSAGEIVRQVDAVFAARKLLCPRWHFADGKVPEELRGILQERGYGSRFAKLWLMKRPANLVGREEFTVIPARASFTKLGELVEMVLAAEGFANEGVLMRAREAAVRHLDDSRVDGLLVLEDEMAVGMAYLVTAGETGVIENLRVHPERLRRGIATMMLERLLELAGRSRIRHLMLFCREGNMPAERLYAKTGFEAIYARESMRLP